jgi:predicted transcriptional regulator
MKVQEIVVFKGATPYNSICTELINHPKNFRRTEGKKGWWELVSYQEEVAALKKENEELKESNKRLTSIPKEAEFIERFLDEVMDVYKYDRKKADPIRIIMRTLGHEDAVAVLTAWIDEKEDELAKALEKLKIQIHNITMTGNDATYNEYNDNDKDE